MADGRTVMSKRDTLSSKYSQNVTMYHNQNFPNFHQAASDNQHDYRDNGAHKLAPSISSFPSNKCSLN